MKKRNALTAKQHFRRDCQRGVLPYGRGESRKISVLLVPELRKRRSERNQELIKLHTDARFDRLAEYNEILNQMVKDTKWTLEAYL